MKLILTITSGTLQGQSFELSNGFISIGRSEHSSIRFDPLTEKIASKQHAFIETQPDGFYIRDNQSTNGTLVNGQKIQTARLTSGDIIQFGTNGVTANVQIQEASSAPPPTMQYSPQPPPPGPENFGQFQFPEFPRNLEPSAEIRNSISNIGMGAMHPITQEEKPMGLIYVGIAVALFFFVFLALLVVGIVLLELGPVVGFIAAVVAFIPPVFYVMPLVWLDRFDPEPIWLLAAAFAWGALVAVFVSFVINSVLGAILGNFFGTVVSAPIFEEGSKGLGLIILLLFFRKYFDGILDGLIFAGVIALGFATVENVLYYGRGLMMGGFQGMAILVFVRGVLSPFAHVTFTSMTGIGCGMSRESHNIAIRLLLPVVGYICAVLLHGFWNLTASIGLFLPVYIVLEIPFFLIFVGFTFYIMYRQNKILREMLAIDVARGLIPQEHLDIATSAFRSFTWVWSGVTQGKYLPRRKYLRAIGKLGLSYWHIQRATSAQGQTGSFQQNPILRDQVLLWRGDV
ncbi:MAG: PrsW family glutamic-type intramembrane protease [Pyrinomonadaceae bacterium]